MLILLRMHFSTVFPSAASSSFSQGVRLCDRVSFRRKSCVAKHTKWTSSNRSNRATTLLPARFGEKPRKHGRAPGSLPVSPGGKPLASLGRNDEFDGCYGWWDKLFLPPLLRRQKATAGERRESDLITATVEIIQPIGISTMSVCVCVGCALDLLRYKCKLCNRAGWLAAL